MATWTKVKKRFRVFTRLKQWFGLRGVAFQLQISPTVAKAKGFLNGTLFTIAKSNQTVKDIKVTVKEDWSAGSGEEKTRDTFELGQIVLPGFSMKKGEKRQIEFQLPFVLIPSPQSPVEERSVYSIEAIGTIEGTAFGPKAKKTFQLL